MRILLIHNKYKQAGGENAFSKRKANLLSTMGISLSKLVLNNSTIKLLWTNPSRTEVIYNPATASELRHKIVHFVPTLFTFIILFP